MHFLQKILTLSTFFVLLVGCASNSPSPAISLLDKDLSQFHNIYPHGEAVYNNGELILKSTDNWFFTTKKTYRDFVLTADIKMPDVGEYSNSGIMFRGQAVETPKGTAAMGYQAEVDPSARQWSGGFYDQGRRKWLHPLHKTRSHPDEDFMMNYLPQWTPEMANAYQHLAWNTYRIECRGNEIKIFVNDVLTTHVLDNKAQQGFIGFQHHGSKVLKATGATQNLVRFRNIYITELSTNH
ncbi:3-keto-disaccharide hydrolase [Thalassotalea sp. PLHSN55]|uniref:3-keto-disaccharide hydrolase n=1 Tax=Thalassotalea sp. PLHSN55 TaxID=3435888 RepID=UPI003F82F565